MIPSKIELLLVGMAKFSSRPSMDAPFAIFMFLRECREFGHICSWFGKESRLDTYEKHQCFSQVTCPNLLYVETLFCIQSQLTWANLFLLKLDTNLFSTKNICATVFMCKMKT
jgi:hypothetical protein